MLAADVMTTNVVTVPPEMGVRDVASLLLGQRISAVPVVDGAGALVGIVSEGDLIHRHEAHTERKLHWWSAIAESPRELARTYSKEHGRLAKDVMTDKVVTVDASTPLADVAALLDKHRIKRVPVLDGGRLVGVVSRANILQALLAASAEEGEADVEVDDRAIRKAILSEISVNELAAAEVNVLVSDGVVSLWGAVASEAERAAIRVAAENAKGVLAVEDRMGFLPNSRLIGL